MPPIAGHNLLIISGTSPIGAAIASLAAAEGLTVSIAFPDAARAGTAICRILAAVPGARVRAFVCDLQHDDDPESTLEQLLADVRTTCDGEPLDHVIYTATTPPEDVRPVTDVSARYLRDSVQLSFVVPLLLAKLLPRYVRQSRTSSLTLTSNGNLGERSARGMAVASGWAASLQGTTQGLALDLAPIRVNLVNPGATTGGDEEMTGGVEEEDEQAELNKRTTATMTKSLLDKIGTPEEVAEAYIYLMRDTNTTGSCVNTNGGVLV